jgi:alanyl-tRNA synthetase
MLGNFSFGDYFKEEAIVYAWDYLHGVLGVDRRRLVVSVFGGEGELAADEEAAALWRKVAGFPQERIIRLGAKDNFWQMGETGPCGPCTEIHYCFGEGEPDLARFGEEQDEHGNGWVEIWNLVFMQFERFAGARMQPLPAPSIDTGMGLERIACVVQGVLSNYDTDVFAPLVELASSIAGKPYGRSQAPDDVSMRVLADHARAAAFLIADGVFPDRDARPYVLRRVMRRAIRHGHRLGIDRLFFHECTRKVVELMGGEYPELRERAALIEDIVQQEEQRFRATLKRGLERLGEYQLGPDRRLPGEVAFELYDTYGFPLDLQEVIGREQGFSLDTSGFEARLSEAQERSRGTLPVDSAVARIYKELADELPATTFLGYESERAESELLCLLSGGAR